MKKLSIILFVLSLFVLQGCDSLGMRDKYDLAIVENVENLKKELDNNIKSDDQVNSINFMINNSQSFSNSPSVINAQLAIPNREKVVNNVILIFEPELTVKKEEDEYAGKIITLPYKDFIITKIPSYIAEAATMIPEEYEYGGLGDYYLRAKDEGYVEHKFKLQVTSKSGATQLNGRRIETTYYEIEFSTDKDGKLTMLLEE